MRSDPPTPTALLPERRRLLLEALGVFLAVSLGYALLLSDLWVDDVARYVGEVQSNRFYWDLGHLWMQPLALLVYRAVGGTLDVVRTLELTNIACAALAFAVFHETLRRLGLGLGRSLAAVALAALSFNLIALGPTAHIKLIVMPAFALSLRHAVLWEAEAAGSAGRRAIMHAAASGAWLGVASCILVSMLPIALFTAAGMLWLGMRAGGAGGAGGPAMRNVAVYVAALSAAGIALCLVAFATALATSSTSATHPLAFVLGGIADKHVEAHIGFAGWREVLPRFVFSVVNNFVFLPTLGGLGRAWLWGVGPAPAGAGFAYALGEAAIAALTLVVLGGIVALAAGRLRQPHSGVVMPVAFLIGGAVFSIYFNLNDPEFWIQFTLPLALLAARMRVRWLDRLVWGLALPLVAVVNLGGYAVPKAAFALEEHSRELQRALGPAGLYVGFAGYPGYPDPSRLELGGIERFAIDLVHTGPAARDASETLRRLDEHVDIAHARGGRVLVFRALDVWDWSGPVMVLELGDLPRRQVREHLSARFTLEGPFMVAGFEAWELKPGKAPPPH